MSKKVAVLFSGGLDSTYLVWKNLKDGNIVQPIYIEIQNNENKSILEKNRIELLYKRFKKEFDNDCKLKPIHYVITVSVGGTESALYFKQVPIWIFGMTFIQSLDIDEIQIGYVMNDDAISYLSDIKKIYKSYQSICEPMKPLVFPLTKMKKNDMFIELPKRYGELIISCENPSIIDSKDVKMIQYEPCCKCVPCRHIIESDYYNTYDFPKIYEKNMTYNLACKLSEKGYSVINKNGEDYFDVNALPYEMKKESYQLEFDFKYDFEKERDCINNALNILNNLVKEK